VALPIQLKVKQLIWNSSVPFSSFSFILAVQKDIFLSMYVHMNCDLLKQDLCKFFWRNFISENSVAGLDYKKRTSELLG
jgi:hypothetical protein